MKKESVKSHLSPYSIRRRRTTTINHAFASAIAPVDAYDEAKLCAALRLLEQDPNGELDCVYCSRKAETWDHLVGLVENGQLRGYGHQIGNLVPCCRDCNSRKGSKDWEEFLQSGQVNDSDLETRKRMIKGYLSQHAVKIHLDNAEAQVAPEWRRYAQIKQEILELMSEADAIAAKIRGVIASDPS